jgi:hypothetical protein
MSYKNAFKFVFLFWVPFNLLSSFPVWAAVTPDQAIIAGIHGKVILQPQNASQEAPEVHIGKTVYAGDQLTTEDGDMQVLLGKSCLVTVSPDSTIRIQEASGQHPTVVLVEGVLDMAISPKELGDEGTCRIIFPSGSVETSGGFLHVEIALSETPTAETISVLEGEATVSITSGDTASVTVGAGYNVMFSGGTLQESGPTEVAQTILPACAYFPHCEISKPVALFTLPYPLPIIVPTCQVPGCNLSPPPVLIPPPPVPMRPPPVTILSPPPVTPPLP